MILTFKVKHKLQLEHSLFEKAVKVAQFAFEHGYVSTKNVKHIGLHSCISCQIIRKYGRSKTIKKIHKKVKLIIPGQSVKFNIDEKLIRLPCLKSVFNFWFRNDFTKINQVELDKTWAYVTVTIPDVEVTKSQNFVGIDLNSTSHSVVVANPSTGKVKKLGKQVPHVKKKYRAIRKRLQRQRKFKELKKVANREHQKTVDILHKLTTSIVKEAKENNTGIKIENLKGIRKRCKVKFKKQSNFVLNSWPFYMFKLMLEYKAKKWGVELQVIDPKWTSQKCSRCGHVDKENRTGKVFKCTHCEHVDHADVNAAFNIAVAPEVISSSKKRDLTKRPSEVLKEQCRCKDNS